MKDMNIEKAYEAAKERYSAIGVDTDKALDSLRKISLSPENLSFPPLLAGR